MDIRTKMEEILTSEGIEIITGTTIERFEKVDGKKVIHFKKDGKEYVGRGGGDPLRPG